MKEIVQRQVIHIISQSSDIKIPGMPREANVKLSWADAIIERFGDISLKELLASVEAEEERDADSDKAEEDWAGSKDQDFGYAFGEEGVLMDEDSISEVAREGPEGLTWYIRLAGLRSFSSAVLAFAFVRPIKLLNMVLSTFWVVVITPRASQLLQKFFTLNTLKAVGSESIQGLQRRPPPP
ncbi:hypothetical protein GLOTRDRAFT_127181 [Gloeophyllum trabeum ATCC 11539]|uniref:Uncharacterized protein n=1 Tax=Gloeophyllum trabeum (strain ATCC 11539 / FP-39264 / Madison 617) TaxID=670483 RepID=S7RV89_GLOTA|nr:uncharacterized protein GLOTRDRAFT_127181 [Gloeophyllum trabeum ATCC 11539]EPQ58690.1 hypothetical protein GLOTRDRAFT_127181 [Gloeophyllum trabeum ATCC 11539]